MTDHVYKRINLTGTSKTTIEDAINNAISRAAETVHSLRWFEVEEIRGDIDRDHVSHWQISLKVGFTIES